MSIYLSMSACLDSFKQRSTVEAVFTATMNQVKLRKGTQSRPPNRDNGIKSL